MRALFLVAAVPLAAFGCAELVGVTDLPEAGTTFDGSPLSDGPPPTSVCMKASTALVTTATATDVQAGGGRVYAQQSTQGLVSCPTSAPCASPSLLFNIPVSDKLFDFSAGTNLVYTLQAAADAGSVHQASPDGTGDKALLQNLAYPAWVAVSGSRTFWVDDTSTVNSNVTPAVLHCIGCGSGDQTWITGLNATYAAFADANDVYVLADDGASSFTYGIYGCSVTTACGGSPHVVATGLDTSALTVASDGTHVFVARSDESDIVSIDGAGTATPLALNVDVVALTVDASKGELYFATFAGLVAVVKTDGTGSPSVVSSCDTNFGDIDSIAIDATNVYVLMGTSGTSIFAIPRP
jgi:hypothetical protein